MAAAQDGASSWIDSRAGDDWFGRDKFLHASVSMALSAGGVALTSNFWPKGHWTARGAIGFGGSCLVFGFGKEFVDVARGGVFSWKDITWDVVGSLVGAFVVVGLEALFKTIYTSRHPSPG